MLTSSLPSLLIPIVGLLLPAITIIVLFLYIEAENIA